MTTPRVPNKDRKYKRYRMSMADAIMKDICSKCRRRAARKDRLMCGACANEQNIKLKSKRERCPTCHQGIQRCSICGKTGHKSTTHDLYA